MTEPTKKARKLSLRKEAKVIGTGVAKELVLIGLYGLQELTGADLHYKPQTGKRPWEKRWGEK